MTEAPKRGRKLRPKAVLEGAAAVLSDPPVESLRAAVADPVPGDNGKALSRIVAFFKDTHPDEWEKIRLHPLQHGLDDMVALL